MDSPAPAPSTGETTLQPTPTSRVRRAAETMLIITAAVLLAGIVVTYAGARQYRWRGFDIEVAVQPSAQGRTRLVFTPLGDIRANTHRAPLELKVALRGVSFEEVKKLVLEPPPRDELEMDFQGAARAGLQNFALTQVVLGALAALLVPLISRSRRVSHWIGSGLFGAAAVAVCFYQLSATYDARAFENPTYTGSLREARWIIGLARDGFAKAEALSDRLKRVAANVSALYGRLNSAVSLIPDEDVVRVLHVSDIHNNPAAIGFVRELALNSGVALVIDTGDLTDLGLPVEAGLISGMAQLNVPYVFVAGNHDSRATVEAVSAFPRARILDSEILDVEGLRILGAPDPSSRRPGSGSVDTPDSILASQGAALLALTGPLPRPPDIVAVHNPKQAEALIGKVPLILCGHMHKADVAEERNTVICNAGTTGAAGVRYFDRKGGVPFTAAILGFTRAPNPRLAFIDLVTLKGSLGEYSISRRSFDARPAESAGDPDRPMELRNP